MKNVYIIGHKGMIGSELVSRGYNYLECDITNPFQVKEAISSASPGTIILCAAKTNVDWCQENLTGAISVNVTGVNNIVDVFNGRLIYISTDYIFDGHKFLGSGYRENHTPNPLNYYGKTKWAGEWIATARVNKSFTKIIRTSRLFNKEYVNRKLYNIRSQGPYEFSNVLKRSYLHVNHFVDGLQFVLDNWEKMPTILNISGTDILSPYLFFSAIAKLERFAIGEHLIRPRNIKLRNVIARPIRGGLNVGLAKTLGVPLYSVWEGVELL